jgi:hypothetical protein
LRAEYRDAHDREIELDWFRTPPISPWRGNGGFALLLVPHPYWIMTRSRNVREQYISDLAAAIRWAFPPPDELGISRWQPCERDSLIALVARGGWRKPADAELEKLARKFGRTVGALRWRTSMVRAAHPDNYPGKPRANYTLADKQAVDAYLARHPQHRRAG